MSAQKTVLVVDDDVDVLRLVRETLVALCDCAVDTTPNPEYAFELILKKPYDLLIFDLTMPDLSGATLYSLIRTIFRVALPEDRTLPPLLLMSGMGQGRVNALLREPGVKGFLAKPFSIDRLAEKVMEILPR